MDDGRTPNHGYTISSAKKSTVQSVIQCRACFFSKLVKVIGFRDVIVSDRLASENKFSGSHPNFVNQRTSGLVNAHLISWPSKAQNIQNLENIW